MLGVIDTLEQHINMENQDADIVQSINVNEVTCVLPTKSNPAEAPVARRRKQTHETTSSALQSINRGSIRNAPTRSKKRVKRSPLPITVQVSQQAPQSTRRTSARKRNDRSHSTTTRTAQLARGPNRRSTRIRIISSSRENLGEKERAEETDGNLHAIGQQNSTLDDGDDDRRGEGEKGTTSSLAASNRHYSTLKSFEERFEELLKFKQKFGHCNAPHTKSSEYYSLGMWSSNLRSSYIQLQKGENRHHKLTDANIQRLEEAGFKWTLRPPRRTFDERFEELLKFKQKFGHCNVPATKSSKYWSLGCWCRDLRVAYKRFKKGEKPRIKLALENIWRLEEAGFKWQLHNDVQL